MTNYITRVDSDEENRKLENVMMFVDKVVSFGIISKTLSAFVVSRLSEEKIKFSKDLLFVNLVSNLSEHRIGLLNVLRVAKRHAWLIYKDLPLSGLSEYEALLLLKNNEIVQSNIKLLSSLGCNFLSDWSKPSEKEKVQLFLYALSDVFSDFKHSNKEEDCWGINACLIKLHDLKRIFIKDFFDKSPYDECKIKFNILSIWDDFLRLLSYNICPGGIYHEVFKSSSLLMYSYHEIKAKESVVDGAMIGLEVSSEEIQTEDLNEIAKNKLLNRNSNLLDLISSSQQL